MTLIHSSPLKRPVVYVRQMDEKTAQYGESQWGIGSALQLELLASTALNRVWICLSMFKRSRTGDHVTLRRRCRLSLSLCSLCHILCNPVKELREELEVIATTTKQTRDRVDSVQAAAREDRRTVTDLRNQLERLTEKITDMEDRSRSNNVRLVGLPEGAEGSNAAGFLRVNLSKWIPSLKGRDIEIDQAHRVYDGGRGSDRPRTLIFRVLRWHDRSEILKGARQAYPVKCAQDNVTLLFFPDFSPATMIRRKAFNPVLEEDDSAWSPALPHLSGGN